MRNPPPCSGETPSRQAVLLIHGIGEQQPMATVRSFVETVWSPRVRFEPGSEAAEGEPEIWSKPDHMSDNFELRRLTTDYDDKCIRTDFFEFYWAHLMDGTQFNHVLTWAHRTLWRPPWKVPKPLLSTYLVLWSLGIATFALLSTVFVRIILPWLSDQAPASAAADAVWDAWPYVISFASVLLVAIGYQAKQLVGPVIGDAARYLSPDPSNVRVRHAIRSAGIKLLQKLHDKRESDGLPTYDRIIVVGHSLGSVIGYDLLTLAWPHYHRGFDINTAPNHQALERLEHAARALRDEDRSVGKQPAGHARWQPHGELTEPMQRYQEAQRAYFAAQREAGNTWRVTDFVTAGSPLTHADLLLALDPQDLARRQEERELPTCPPQLEPPCAPGEQPRLSYRPPEQPKDLYQADRRVPHFAAPFAVVRWTNLFFPARAVVWGDLVGGPLAGAFGYGIRDIALEAKPGFRYLSHTKYWDALTGRDPSPETTPHLFKLSEALLLNEPSGVHMRLHSHVGARVSSSARVPKVAGPPDPSEHANEA